MNNPVTVIVDVTTGLYSDLHLDDDVQELLNVGDLSIFAVESHQKFGQAHADQAQYGRVFGICSKKAYKEETMDALESAAKRDLATQVDMIIGAYFNVHCGNYLELIKQQHFFNGGHYAEMLSRLGMWEHQVNSYPLMNNALNKLYFICLNRVETNRLLNKAKAKGIPEKEANAVFLRHTANRSTIEKLVKQGMTTQEIDYLRFVFSVDKSMTVRDSFGHRNTTRIRVGASTRISPNASDTLDCLIEISSFYLVSHFTADELVNFTYEFVLGKDNAPLSLEEKIIAISLLVALKKSAKTDSSDQIIICLAGIKKVLNFGSPFSGRQSLHELQSYYNDINFTIRDNNNLSLILDLLCKGQKITRPLLIAYIKSLRVNDCQRPGLKLPGRELFDRLLDNFQSADIQEATEKRLKKLKTSGEEKLMFTPKTLSGPDASAIRLSLMAQLSKISAHIKKLRYEKPYSKKIKFLVVLSEKILRAYENGLSPESCQEVICHINKALDFDVDLKRRTHGNYSSINPKKYAYTIFNASDTTTRKLINPIENAFKCVLDGLELSGLLYQ